MSDDYNVWYGGAEKDLIAAKLVSDSGVNPELVAFTASLSAEKFLKSLVFYKGIAEFRSHDLEAIADKLESAGMIIPDQIRKYCEDLNDYPIKARYLGIDVTNEMASDAIRCCEGIRDFVRDAISPGNQRVKDSRHEG
ncbi:MULTISPECIES: HEPN domain-containing protein [Cohnella]|uniref:HEPN domain-containing protein n=1 Tax=Cohnella TaxID=329857 RepID=UPI0009B9F45B|nr:MULTISPECIES: HEPN domain-containing protein [Cohnella]MBN2980415.1 HEPN domain-containing protein [Cohnella algarum]